MDSPESNGQPSSLESLRTVEFRQTLRGYHIDDVDEYLERVAVEAEALQEQFRQATDRLRQATDRITTLEHQLLAAREQQTGPTEVVTPDDTLQRTLLLAQKFVDQTQAEAEEKAAALVRDAEVRARTLLSEAEDRARKKHEDADRQLREEVTRLEGIRTHLGSEVDAIARHLDGERSRLRSALTEILQWVDENVQPTPATFGQRNGGAQTSERAGVPEAGELAPRPAAQNATGSNHGTIPTGAPGAPVVSDDGATGEPTGSLFRPESATYPTTL
jgi:cell division initiation protein